MKDILRWVLRWLSSVPGVAATPYVLEADVEVRLVAQADAEMRLVASEDTVL